MSAHSHHEPSEKKTRKRIKLVEIALKAFEKTVKRLRKTGMGTDDAIRMAQRMFDMSPGGH